MFLTFALYQMVAKKSIKTNIHWEGNKKEESNIWEKLSIKERGEETKGFLKRFKSLFRYADIGDISMLLFVAWLFLLSLLIMLLIFKLVL